MGVKNIIGDLNINGDLNVTGTIMQNGAPIGGGGEPGTFDFSGSDFTNVNMKLFSGNSDFVEEPATIILPSTVTSISVNMFDGASGDFKLFLNSAPSVSASYIPANVDVYFDVSENILASDAFSASSWSTLTSQMVLFATGIESGVALQPYTTGSGVPITWYTDETFTTTVSVSAGSENKYYGKVLNPSANRVTYCVRTLNLTNASVDIVDDNSGVHYDRFIPVGATVTITPSTTDESKDILLTFNVNGTSYKSVGTATITVNSDVEIIATFSDIAVDPILENNSWEDIRNACEIGSAASYWSIGDTKTDVGTDGITRIFRIADMSGLYGKHVVFEQVNLTNQSKWNETNSLDSDSCSNNWELSYMRVTFLPSYLTKLSTDLQNSLTNTTIQTAKNTVDTTLISTTDKLFLPAEKEVVTVSNYWYDIATEWATLITYSYYGTHTSIAEIKYTNDNNAKEWWLRGPAKNENQRAHMVNKNNGSVSVSYTNTSYIYVAPCFSF